MSAPRTIGLIVIFCLFACPVRADFLVLKSGYVIFGKVKSRGPQGIELQRTSGTYPYAPATITREYEASKDSSLPNRLLPGFGPVIDRLGTEAWASEVKQIPAIVISKGILRNVPYISFRFGVDYEANIYGDPENPACIEIGFYRSLLKNPDAKRNCMAYVAAMFAGTPLETSIGELNLESDLKKAGDWTLEITPPDAEDSFGGWWISIYSESLLDKSRATPKELGRIAVSRSAIRPTQVDDSWTAGELRNARPNFPIASATTYSRTNSPDVPSSGSVYVRGYFRKNGTYVRPHSRKR